MRRIMKHQHFRTIGEIERLCPTDLDMPPPSVRLNLAAHAIAEAKLSSPAPGASKRQMKSFWKELSKRYTPEQISTMKHLQKYGGEALRHYETVESPLSL